MTNSNQHRILISRPDRIGDVVLSTPLPREIKKKYPNSFIAVLVRSYTKDIFVNNPYVDEIIIVDKILTGSKTDLISEVKNIRKYSFTHALMLLPNERINYLLFLAGIRTRIGVGHKFYQFITGVKSVHRNKYIPLRHEADYCMDLARKIGVESNDLTPEIYLTSDEKIQVGKIRKSLLGNKKYLVGIHTSSGNSAPNWAPRTYAKLIEKLKLNESIQLVVTDPNVSEEIRNISDIIIPSEIIIALREFAILDLLVSSSTGPMHICAAFKVKTVSLFCPLTACSPKLWGPLGNKSKVILPSEGYCQNECPGDPKKCKFAGQGGIEINEVVKAINDLLIS